MKPKEKNVYDIRKLIDYSYEGTYPKPSKDEWKKLREVWNLRIDIAIYMGMSEKQIIKEASENIKQNSISQIGCGSDGSSRWENIENSRRFGYISSLLPEIEVLHNKYNKFKIIFSEREKY